MSAIEWTDETWNPTTGCTIVSPGCHNCYAMRMARRHDGRGIGYDGTTKQTRSGPQWTGQVNLLPARLEIPLRWRKPRRVFVDSMSDLFHESIPFEYIDQVFAVMALATEHTFQVLTKRPERMAEYLNVATPHWSEDLPRDREWHVDDAAIGIARGVLGTIDWPLPNVWLGTSVEDQQRADERIWHLRATPAAVRFISYEPALGAVHNGGHCMDCGAHTTVSGLCQCTNKGRLHWWIVGGESGPGARPMDIAWPRSIVEQCREAQVPVFVKQLGADPYLFCPFPGCEPDPADGGPGDCPTHGLDLRDPKGGDPSEWPEDLRVRDFPHGTEPEALSAPTTHADADPAPSKG